MHNPCDMYVGKRLLIHTYRDYSMAGLYAVTRNRNVRRRCLCGARLVSRLSTRVTCRARTFANAEIFYVHVPNLMRSLGTSGKA